MSEAPAEAPEPDETPTDPEAPETPEEPVQPAEAPEAKEAMGQVIELHGERGALALRPNQTELDTNQKAALVAIGIDVANDPQVVPHIRPFMHMCQVKGLDPWAREAYLIGRGKGGNRKYTMQTGIDGYRKIAKATGRFLRVKETLWTGQDDDDRTWYRDEQTGVMRRIWWDQWPASRGYPGAAKVIIEHLDETGAITTTEGIADWSMYAPFSDKYEGYGQNRYKVMGDDGKPVQELNEMWRKGYAHMLAKCAEALADRKAFPAAMSGVYTHEEMHQRDQHEQNRMAAEARQVRAAAYQEATGKAPSAPLPAGPPHQEHPADPASGPLPVGDVVPEMVEQIASAFDAGPEQRAEWLREELGYQADVLGHTPSKLAARPMRALRKNVEDFTDAELLPLVAGLRPATLARLREIESPHAERYAALTDDTVLDVAAYLAGQPEEIHDAEVVEDEPDPAEDPRLDADPAQPHEPVLVGGLCEVCGEEADYILHADFEDDTQAT